ncbi:MAG: 2-succinyl-5-enolpyruvyl-6-hydroxy-3-cyclohexene-1-carboxylic-acid synthase [Candidatus Marinimicrobia bacterium]|nr:2-succinyl-5-enolpyruvyl-6-hydroxy-3-cyclohexene-1-carboxylic-acid synthase [Candidatus Neomarinimicrobiota bacterium]MCH7762638.1 2-succinyl-5-enolpyruvyl-6-hydroxy-3-cyclohexene-1-carboxylic-acid synthase [Candidatus Neomarinimicrobiota bacterium]
MKSVALQNTRHIYELIDLCAQFGVRKAVVCPGSRCAPLLIGFGKHPGIETFSITDERSAGFVCLGLAQQSGEPVVLVCTSGTAAQNFAPAVTEAFYQMVPLLILTADRPPEWIDQWDGQTIHQKNVYIDHVKGSFVFDEENLEVAEEALDLAMTEARGPVHLNIPIREPFYPDSIDDVLFATETRSSRRYDIIKEEILNDDFWQELQTELNSVKKIMILGGQSEPNPELVGLLNQIDVPIVADVISNLHEVKNVIKSADLVFKTNDENLLTAKGTEDTKINTIIAENLKPDLLITFGRSVISTNLKLYLRKHKPKAHWHIGLGMVGDPFQSLTKTVQVSPAYFFSEWLKRKIAVPYQNQYQSVLAEAQIKVDAESKSILDVSVFNYFSAVAKVINVMPENSVLHLGNSMPVRIANFIGLDKPNVDVYSNRGTSGIDGTVSTAVGHALADPSRTHTIIVGDLAFFYDRNGLWLNHKFPQNLRIVILNDGGGGIFNIISGPSNQGELTELFTTPHKRTAELTAKEFELEYWGVKTMEELEKMLEGFESGILEIFTDMKINKNVFNKLTTETQSHKN